MLVPNVGSRDVIRSRKTILSIDNTELSSLKRIRHSAKDVCQCGILPKKKKKRFPPNYINKCLFREETGQNYNTGICWDRMLRFLCRIENTLEKYLNSWECMEITDIDRAIKICITVPWINGWNVVLNWLILKEIFSFEKLKWLFKDHTT